MKRNLIVVCNPKKESFTESMANTVRCACEEKGVECKVRNLYDMNFNPLLTEEELLDMTCCVYADDVKEEQDYIKWADILTFIYPIWWANMPSMMKGYIDRVICKNFAYYYTDEGTIQGLLTDKKVMIINPFGNTEAHYKATGMFKAMNTAVENGVFNFCGAKILLHNYYGSIHKVDDATLTSYLRDAVKDVQALL